MNNSHREVKNTASSPQWLRTLPPAIYLWWCPHQHDCLQTHWQCETDQSLPTAFHLYPNPMTWGRQKNTVSTGTRDLSILCLQNCSIHPYQGMQLICWQQKLKNTVKDKAGWYLTSWVCYSNYPREILTIMSASCRALVCADKDKTEVCFWNLHTYKCSPA